MRDSRSFDCLRRKSFMCFLLFEHLHSSSIRIEAQKKITKKKKLKPDTYSTHLKKMHFFTAIRFNLRFFSVIFFIMVVSYRAVVKKSAYVIIRKIQSDFRLINIGCNYNDWLRDGHS